MNWGRTIGYALVVLCFATAIGYTYAHDWRKAIYFALCGAINLTVVY
jgi:uncharacterized membrane protein